MLLSAFFRPRRFSPPLKKFFGRKKITKFHQSAIAK